jgi:hypothetical protein
MEQYVGLDISLKETSLWVVDQTGTTLWQGKCVDPESIATVLARRALAATRIGLEAGCCRPVIEALLNVWRSTGEQLVTCTGACCGSPRPTRPAAAIAADGAAVAAKLWRARGRRDEFY